jgi:alkylation response protein AidB-like acyl-CoA dehydrogenase
MTVAVEEKRAQPGTEDTLTFQTLLERFQPVLEEIAKGAAEREAKRQLAYDALALLVESGFTALRVPHAYGGIGASLSQSVLLLARLGEADSNLVQALRAHFTTVETYRLAGPEVQERWFPRVVAGAVFGNATTERGNPTGRNNTLLEERGGDLVLNGTKYYSTGSLYADWIKVHADLPTGGSVRVAVHRDDPGVELVDDWDGFGQRLTASGTTRLTNVVVDPQNVVPFDPDSGPSPFASYVQLILLAALTGVGRAVRRDAVEYVQSRNRVFAHGIGDDPKRDPLVQETVGRISATVFGIEAALAAAADAAESAFAAVASGALDSTKVAELDTTTAEAQLVIVDNVLQVATQLFEVGGASAASSSRGLDRHWRNARVLGSHNPLAYRAREIGQQRLTGDSSISVVYIGASAQTPNHPASQEATA